MPIRIILSLLVLCALAAPERAPAQASQSSQSKQPPMLRVEIPRGLRPPPGMCRIWIDKVPAAQQPAPTDCASAIRNRPPNGRVIFPEQDKAAPKDTTKGPPPRKPPERDRS